MEKSIRCPNCGHHNIFKNLISNQTYPVNRNTDNQWVSIRKCESCYSSLKLTGGLRVYAPIKVEIYSNLISKQDLVEKVFG